MVSDKEILVYVRDCWGPIVGTSEVADEFGYSTTKGARKRLYQLEEEGYLDSKKVGRVPVFWITEDGLDQIRDMD